jgi:hypothetical protein
MPTFLFGAETFVSTGATGAELAVVEPACIRLMVSPHKFWKFLTRCMPGVRVGMAFKKLVQEEMSGRMR